jgi:hypothetical protein
MKQELSCSNNEDVTRYRGRAVPEGICELRMR